MPRKEKEKTSNRPREVVQVVQKMIHGKMVEVKCYSSASNYGKEPISDMSLLPSIHTGNTYKNSKGPKSHGASRNN
jgi:hypothetical protein